MLHHIHCLQLHHIYCVYTKQIPSQAAPGPRVVWWFNTKEKSKEPVSSLTIWHSRFLAINVWKYWQKGGGRVGNIHRKERLMVDWMLQAHIYVIRKMLGRKDHFEMRYIKDLFHQQHCTSLIKEQNNQGRLKKNISLTASLYWSRREKRESYVVGCGVSIVDTVG